MLFGRYALQPRDEQADTDRHRVRVLIVHPDRLFREALAVALAAQQNPMSVVGCVADMGEAHKMCQHAAMTPDIIMLGGQRRMLDVHRQALRLRSGFKAVKLLLIDNQVATSRPHLFHARHRTDLGFVSPDSGSFRRLLQRLHGLNRSRRDRCPDGGLTEPLPHETVPHPERGDIQDQVHLTRREEEVFRLRRNGLSNKEVAVALHIGVQTVKNHVRSLSAKLRLHRARGGQTRVESFTSRLLPTDRKKVPVPFSR